MRHWFLCFSNQIENNNKIEPGWVKIFGPFLYKKEAEHVKSSMEEKNIIWQNSAEILFVESEKEALKEYRKIQCDRLFCS